jgi:hypothetical protein
MASIPKILLHLERKRSAGTHDTLRGQGKATLAKLVG